MALAAAMRAWRAPARQDAAARNAAAHGRRRRDRAHLFRAAKRGDALDRARRHRGRRHLVALRSNASGEAHRLRPHRVRTFNPRIKSGGSHDPAFAEKVEDTPGQAGGPAST